MVLALIMLMLVASPGFGEKFQQMGGQMAPDSPTDFKIGKTKVHFLSEGTKVVGHLYLPRNYKKNDRLPAIVIVGPKGSVKEQTQGIYAKKLSEKGFITLAFDHRTYGESGGEPRHYENPHMKIEDVKTAVSYVGSLDVVDKDRIGLLGICNGGAFGAAAAIYDKRVKAYASVSGIFDMRSQIINGKPGDREKLSGIMKKSGEARQKFFETGEVDYVKQMTAADKNSNQLRKEAANYYLTSRGRVPNWGENKMVVFSMDTRRSFDITDQIGLLSPTPYLAVAGEKALTLGLSEKSFKRANDPKELFKIGGATHMALYDVGKYVNQVVSRLDKFYTKAVK